jgi:hypothetical protein
MNSPESTDEVVSAQNGGREAWATPVEEAENAIIKYLTISA